MLRSSRRTIAARIVRQEGCGIHVLPLLGRRGSAAPERRIAVAETAIRDWPRRCSSDLRPARDGSRCQGLYGATGASSWSRDAPLRRLHRPAVLRLQRHHAGPEIAGLLRLLDEPQTCVGDHRCAQQDTRLPRLQPRLYDAIGEPDNRNRKPAAMGAAVERVMLLDAVLASRDIEWLATERDKVAHFTTALWNVARHERVAATHVSARRRIRPRGISQTSYQSAPADGHRCSLTLFGALQSGRFPIVLGATCRAAPRVTAWRCGC